MIKIPSRMDLNTYKTVCHIVSIHDANKKRYNAKMEEIITLKSCLDVHVDGGDGTTNAERAAQQYDRFAKTSLCQMVEAVEKAKNGVVMAQESDEAYGWRLVNALLESCKNPYKKNFYYLNENCDLYTTYRTFYRWKRSFIEDIAIQLGLIDEYNGMLESWEA